ncbi:MAG: hypothetical protein IT406_04190 [Candidatus Yanofskybacteria bacterium]|nr:hypothetical protein [Candidatus Yanofskybacteria bacterium]
MLRHIRTATPVIIGILLVAFALIAGEMYNLYLRIGWLDKALHFLGGVIAAWFVLALFQRELPQMRGWKQILVLAGITALIGVVWEWAEYASTLARPYTPWLYHYFHGGNLADTLADLGADIGGALALSWWALHKERSA